MFGCGTSNIIININHIFTNLIESLNLKFINVAVFDIIVCVLYVVLNSHSFLSRYIYICIHIYNIYIYILCMHVCTYVFS